MHGQHISNSVGLVIVLVLAGALAVLALGAAAMTASAVFGGPTF